IEKAEAIIDEKSPNLENKKEVAKTIGIGAVVFFALYNGRIKDIDFWWDRALNFEGETGPYVMYTHARSCSVLRKAGKCLASPDYSALNAPEAQAVVKLIDAFPDTIRLALQRSEPSLITRFSVELAKAFNKFYYESRILDDDMSARRAKLNLTIAAKTTIKTALGLIGIGAPERM
ncbi:MAG: arginine--tRNA ligase, partial [Clostridia bacterium]|nr:arginine--tRNA ligase [Clostridia bacterium]